MCCGRAARTKRNIVLFPPSSLRLPGMAPQPFFQSPLSFCFDQSNQINSPLGSPADLVAPAHKLSKKHVRDVPPAASDTTHASSACTDLIRNTMPFIFLAHRGRLADLQLQEQGCRSFSMLLFFCLSLSLCNPPRKFLFYLFYLTTFH